MQNSRLTAEFGDTIKWIKEHPNDEQALKTFFTLLHKTNINVSTREIIKVLLDPPYEISRINYLAGFLSGYSIPTRDVSSEIISDKFPENANQLERRSGFLSYNKQPSQSALSRKLALCLRSIDAGDPLHDLRPTIYSDYNYFSRSKSEKTECICFITECNITIRIRKLAKMLRNAGEKVKIIVRSSSFYPPPSREDFDEIVLLPDYPNPFQLWDEMAQTNASSFHCFVADRHGYFEALAAMVFSPYLCVIDFYDFSHSEIGPIKRFSEGTPQWQEFNFHNKIYRFLINHAAGLCCRNLFSKHQKSFFSDHSSLQLRICLPELAWGNVTKKDKKLSHADGSLHAVVASTFFTGTRYNDKFRGYPLLDKSKELEIQIHLYAMTQTLGEYDDLETQVRRLENVHLHKPVSYPQWQSECSRYDIGLFRLYPRDNSQMENIPLAWDPGGAWSNKFGDYLDGDVFMVMGTDLKYQAFVAKRYGIGTPADEGDLLDKNFWRNLQTKLQSETIDFKSAKKKLNTSTQGKRLLEFYQKLGLNASYKNKF